jgi:hypothetical protein
MMNSLVAILLLGLAAFAQAEVTCDECIDATSKKKAILQGQYHENKHFYACIACLKSLINFFVYFIPEGGFLGYDNHEKFGRFMVH